VTVKKAAVGHIHLRFVEQHGHGINGGGEVFFVHLLLLLRHPPKVN
jgi:hypothetical protein